MERCVQDKMHENLSTFSSFSFSFYLHIILLQFQYRMKWRKNYEINGKREKL